MMQSSRKPPLPRSPIRLRPRRAVLRPNLENIQTPTGSSMKTQLSRTTCEAEESGVRPEYRTISCELRALAKMVHQEFSGTGDCLRHGGVVVDGDDAGGGGGLPNSNSLSSPLFERGRLYEEYAARRNERLKRKKGWETADAKKPAAGNDVEPAKRRDTRRFESLRKTTVPPPPCATTPMTQSSSSSSSSRYLLRSSTSSYKENKIPPSSAAIADQKIGFRRARKKRIV